MRRGAPAAQRTGAPGPACGVCGLASFGYWRLSAGRDRGASLGCLCVWLSPTLACFNSFAHTTAMGELLGCTWYTQIEIPSPDVLAVAPPDHAPPPGKTDTHFTVS
eukprot:5191290-Prymnesium_polylepis.1